MPSTDRRYQYFDRAGRLVLPEDAVDHRGVMKDGITARVPVMLRDSAAIHKPGFRLSDACNDEREAAWREMMHDAENAWRHPTADRKKKTVVKRDPHGRLLSTSEEEEEDDTYDHQTTLTLDEARELHDRRCASALEDYQRDLENAWKVGK